MSASPTLRDLYTYNVQVTLGYNSYSGFNLHLEGEKR